MQDKLFIDGRWVAPVNSGTLDVIDPATEEVFHKIPAATAPDVDRAAKAVREAFDTGPWPAMKGAERARYLRAIADKIIEKKDYLENLEVRDNGKPLPEAAWDMDDVAGCFQFYANLAEESDAKPEEEILLGDTRFQSKVVREPLGVVGAITPWNYPLLMVAWKVAPALAAGCTMVLKPSELASLTTLELGVIAEEVGLPKDVLNIVTGLGQEAGSAITEHPSIDKLAFTGSVATGRKVMIAGAQDIKNVSLELGGKSPFVVFADSDIEQAVEWIMFGIFGNQGQVCSATSRVLIEESIYDQVLARLVEETRKTKIGNGLADGTLLGPIISRGQYDKILAAIERGKAEGATIATGGQRPADLNTGYFLEPTVLTDMSEDSWVWQEEIFGPVVCVKPFKSEGEAIRMANNSKYGLAAAVMSTDLKRAERVAKAFRAGIVWINCSQPTFTDAPWGGYKQSGIGRELGKWGFENYLEVKQITGFYSDEPWGWYIK
jgi:betaine-aldehyde dehydrogenase